MHQNTDWEKELREELWTEVMEDYVITAELGHLAKDQGKHKEEMRGHFDKLLNWYAQKLQAREEEIREILKSFRDDSEKPTEIGLLIENILARLTPNKK